MSGSLTWRIVGVLAVLGVPAASQVAVQGWRSPSWTRVFDCLLPDPAQSPLGEDIAVTFADSSALGDRPPRCGRRACLTPLRWVRAYRGITQGLTRDSALRTPAAAAERMLCSPSHPWAGLASTVDASTSSPFPVRCSADIHQHAH